MLKNSLPTSLLQRRGVALRFLTTIGAALCASVAMAAAPSLEDYQIEPEDVLEIYVWKEEQLQREVVVRPDGGVSFPLVGSITAAGKTTSALEADITKELSEYIPDAVVSVSIKELKGLRIYVNGKVKKPGEYTLGRYVDVLQALTLAGGVTPFADANDIRILRRENGKEVVYRFNYSQVEKGKNLSQNIVLKPSDVVIVP